jgi:hypothetical protein
MAGSYKLSVVLLRISQHLRAHNLPRKLGERNGDGHSLQSRRYGDQIQVGSDFSHPS